MDGLASVLAFKVGKHLGDVQAALPLRAVCKDWADTVTMTSESAKLDLHPNEGEQRAATIGCKRDVFKLCPSVRNLTYYVSPRVSNDQFAACMAELDAKLPQLETLVLIFNNAGQQLEQCHLDALACLRNLRSLSLSANVSPGSSFAPLGDLEHLTELRLMQSEHSTGLTDAHVESLSELYALEALEFPGHASCFTGATIKALDELDSLGALHITWPRGATETYTLCSEARAGLHLLLDSAQRAGRGLELELAVPTVDWVSSLLGCSSSSSSSAGEPPGAAAARLSVCVREPASSEQIARVASLPAKGRLVRLDLELLRALSAGDVAAISQLTSLQRLQLTSKAVCKPSQQLDLSKWVTLSSLQSFQLHINPAWRKPLDRATVAALAAAWPRLAFLHLRLSAADLTDRALDALRCFGALQQLSLQWLDTAAIFHPSQPLPALSLAALPPHLKSLSLSSISAVRIVTPVVCAGAASELPPLEALVLDGNFGLNDELMGALCCLLPRLQHLSLVLLGRQALSGAGFAAVASLAALRCVSVRDLRDGVVAPVLTQACVRALAPLAPRLRSLRLSTPDLLRRELQPDCFLGFAKLRELELPGCQEAAEAALGAALPLCSMQPRSGARQVPMPA